MSAYQDAVSIVRIKADTSCLGKAILDQQLVVKSNWPKLVTKLVSGLSGVQDAPPSVLTIIFFAQHQAAIRWLGLFGSTAKTGW